MLLSKHGPVDQEVCHIMWTMHQRLTQTDKKLTRPPLQNTSDYITAPEDALQFGMVPELPPSVGYENMVTTMDLLLRYLFAYPTSSLDPKTVARVKINIMNKPAYLPMTIITDMGSTFVSHVTKEATDVLGITLKHASPRHAQTIGKLERSHASIKQASNLETSQRRALSHEYISNAVLNSNTSYHAGIGCKPSRGYHGRIPYNVPVLEMAIRPQKSPKLNSQVSQDVFDPREMFFQDVCKYKAYYDKRANASKLKEQDYLYVLQPKADH